MKHRGEKWTIEEIELTKRLYSEYIKIDDIAIQVNHSNSAILHKLKQFNITSRRIDWTEKDLENLKIYFNQGLTYSEISKKLNKTIRACQGKAIRLGLKKKECNVWLINGPRDDFWTEEQLSKMKELIESGASRKEIANLIGKSEHSINNKMYELRLFLKQKSKEKESLYRRNYMIDDDYFENIDSQRKAYWLGWMITDGYVGKTLNTKRGIVINNRVGLHLQFLDKYVLEDFKNDLKSNYPLLHKRKKRTQLFKNKYTGKEYSINANESYCLNMTSAKMVQDLAKYGVVQNKTYDVIFPKELKEEFYPGFIAGVISGDGSISLKNNHNTSVLLRGSIAGNIGLLEPIKEILVKNIGYNPDKKIFKCKTSKCLYNLELNQTETIKLYYWLKENGISLMKRKNDIIENYINENKYRFGFLPIGCL